MASSACPCVIPCSHIRKSTRSESVNRISVNRYLVNRCGLLTPHQRRMLKRTGAALHGLGCFSLQRGHTRPLRGKPTRPAAQQKLSVRKKDPRQPERRPHADFLPAPASGKHARVPLPLGSKHAFPHQLIPYQLRYSDLSTTCAGSVLFSCRVMPMLIWIGTWILAGASWP